MYCLVWSRLHNLVLGRVLLRGGGSKYARPSPTTETAVISRHVRHRVQIQLFCSLMCKNFRGTKIYPLWAMPTSYGIVFAPKHSWGRFLIITLLEAMHNTLNVAFEGLRMGLKVLYWLRQCNTVSRPMNAVLVGRWIGLSTSICQMPLLLFHLSHLYALFSETSSNCPLSAKN